ncbi:hypothetical protein SAMN05421510_10768 [Nitrosomonas ureae]|uniref:Uncharacterized protein n=2 Tax=Nitrosomonas ureae TaxID=44577 RepID=A0A1H9GTS1_9PROT|nr:hypothetical protein SAMN05421510_10768 [Nitrosomonas ureae]
MDTYELLLNQITPFLESQFSNLPEDLKERISRAGMGEKTNKKYCSEVEEFHWVHIEAGNKFLTDDEAKEIEEGEGIRKGKGIRSKIKTEHYYIWDTLSALQREYKVARYDFENCPNHREKAASSKLAEAITPYLITKFSDLPQEMRMNIAYVDIFQKWDEISTKQRKQMARDFDARMQPDYEKTVTKYCDLELERQSIPDQIFFWQRLNPNRIASEQIIIDTKIKELGEREVELEELLGYQNSNTKQVFKQSKSTISKSAGRPKSVKNNAMILNEIIKVLAEGKNIIPGRLPGSARDLHDACKRIAQAKLQKNMFNTTLNTFKEWLKAAGYGFGNGRTPSIEAKFWTDLCVKNIGKIDSGIFTKDSG